MAEALARNVVRPDQPDSVSDDAKIVLVVDDSKVQRKILAASLTRWGYRVIETGSPSEALKISLEEPVDIILSDWVMPEMSGLDFCTAFRQLDREEYGYFILLTSKSDKNDIAHGLRMGADDFLIKPVNADELRARILAGTRIQDMHHELRRKNQEVNAALTELQDIQEAINRDLAEARKLQQSLVRDTYRDFGAASASLLCRPSGEVGGDLVGAFTINDNMVGVYAVDVSGHGITSALMTARLSGYLSGSSRDQNVAMSKQPDGTYSARSPSQVASELNRLVLKELKTDHYFTMLLAYLDLTSGEIVLCQAGHPHPQLRRADGRVELLGEGGLPIGLFEPADYEDVRITLTAGDRLLIASDGMTECADPDGRLLEDDGLTAILSRNAGRSGPEFLAAALTELSEFAHTDAFEDDISAVVLDYKGDFKGPTPQT